MLAIVALVMSPDGRARIVTAIGGRAKVRFVANPHELADAVASSRPGAVICEFNSHTAAGVAAAARELRIRRPTLPMIGYCWVEAHASWHLMTAVRAGVSALALRGVDDVGVMLDRVLVEAQADCVSGQVTRGLTGHAPSLVRDALDFCIRHTRGVPDVADLAAALYLPRRTLGDRLQRAGAPSASALISWSRLFVAAELLEDEGRSVEAAALAVGFVSGSALRGMLRRYAGITPRELRQRGGLSHFVAVFVARLPTVYQHLPIE